MYNLKDKTIIITGASMGIGKCIAETFSIQGAKLILLSRNTEKLKDITSKLENKDHTYYSLDISNAENVESVFKNIIKSHKRIDVLINNAGITSDNLIMSMKDQQWHEVINTNLNGCYYCCKSISKQLIRQKFGKIINISSIIGQIGNKGQSNYAASKAGIIGLTKSLAKELAQRNITVNAISPGFIETSMTKNLAIEEFLKDIPLKKLPPPTTIEISIPDE